MTKVKNISKALVAASLLITSVLSPMPSPYAEAAPSDELKSQRATLVSELEQAQKQANDAEAEWYAAEKERQAAEKSVLSVKQRADEANAKLVELRERMDKRAIEMYKTDPLALIASTLLGTSSIDEAVRQWNAIEQMNKKDAELTREVKTVAAEAEAMQQEAEQAQSQVQIYEDIAKAAHDKAATEAAALGAKIEAIDVEIRDAVEKEAQERLALAARNSAGISGAGLGIPENGEVVDYAMSRLGCPYVWGAEGPDTFDCSGLVMWCYAKKGIYLPHYSEDQKDAAIARIPVDEAKPGDVLYRPGHVAISLGGNTYIHAPHTGDVVRVASGGSWTCALRF